MIRRLLALVAPRPVPQPDIRMIRLRLPAAVTPTPLDPDPDEPLDHDHQAKGELPLVPAEFLLGRPMDEQELRAHLHAIFP